MFQFIEQVKENSKINVCGKIYTAVAKTIYVTEQEPNNWYVKLVMDDHSILVLAPFDDFIYFGTINNIFGESSSFKDDLIYNSCKFSKVAEDYQIVKNLVFGNPLTSEGEVHYADYTAEENEDVYISLAVVSRTKKRADIVAKILSLSDLSME